MLTFAAVLRSAGIDPAEVRLLRHHKAYPGGRTPYSLWRDTPELFDLYQATQDAERRAYFAAPYWVSFVVTPAGTTVFVGLYSAELTGPVPADMIDPLSGEYLALQMGDHTTCMIASRWWSCRNMLVGWPSTGGCGYTQLDATR